MHRYAGVTINFIGFFLSFLNVAAVSCFDLCHRCPCPCRCCARSMLLVMLHWEAHLPTSVLPSWLRREKIQEECLNYYHKNKKVFLSEFPNLLQRSYFVSFQIRSKYESNFPVGRESSEIIQWMSIEALFPNTLVPNKLQLLATLFSIFAIWLALSPLLPLLLLPTAGDLQNLSRPYYHFLISYSGFPQSIKMKCFGWTLKSVIKDEE